jgi:hypothetical protein
MVNNPLIDCCCNNKQVAYRKIDFIMAYTQATISRTTYTELLSGVSSKGMNKKTHHLKIPNNIHGGKETGRIWYLYLKNVPASLGYRQSKYEECAF